MGKVVILDENTANKIAAGEVIERPASVVKELVENSIDAGATTITVEIKNGGISYLRVADNGSGINDDDVEIAFERHATSKIRSADDLDSIASLGFRGEALASIAAVSRVELTTRIKENEHGTLIQIQGGRVNEVKQTGCPVGTTITIRELFFNTPARYKFLKKDSTEAGYISDILGRIALGHPHISLRLISGGSTVLHTPGNNDLKSTIYSIYGKETSHGLYEVNYSDTRLKITGFTGKPEIARSNRQSQSIYINGRYIRSKIITSAMDEAYKTYLMKNKYPFAVLHIRINPSTVDVNVHPTKMEVRFSEEQEIFRSIYHAITNALLQGSNIRQAKLDREEPKAFQFEREVVRPVFTQQSLNYQAKPQRNFSEARPSQIKEISDFLFKPGDIAAKRDETRPDGDKKVDLEQEKHFLADVLGIEISKNNTQGNTVKDTAKDTGKEIENYEVRDTKNETLKDATIDTTIHSAVRLFEGARWIGQLFSTYILLQMDGQLIVIDQHAAHERILYERLLKRNGKSYADAQELLTPLVIQLTHQEITFLNENTHNLIQLGFNFENFGNNSIILRTVPYAGDTTEIKQSLMNVLDYMLHSNAPDIEKASEEALFTLACKAAVKANQNLTEPEVYSLLEQMESLDNPFTCPHGRPAAIRITKTEMEKMFKRIV